MEGAGGGLIAQGTPDPTAAVSVQVEASMLPGINGGFVTYRVDTSTTLPGFARPEASVRRRFREFVARLLPKPVAAECARSKVYKAPRRRGTGGLRAAAESITDSWTNK